MCEKASSVWVDFLFISSLVVALKIHVSDASKHILDRLGGYVLESRGTVHMKVDFRNIITISDNVEK